MDYFKFWNWLNSTNTIMSELQGGNKLNGPITLLYIKHYSSGLICVVQQICVEDVSSKFYNCAG